MEWCGIIGDNLGMRGRIMEDNAASEFKASVPFAYMDLARVRVFKSGRMWYSSESAGLIHSKMIADHYKMPS